MEGLDGLVKDINERMTSIGKATEPEALKKIVNECLTEMAADANSPLARKIRFGRESDSKLVGTKYARWGLNASDVEWLHDVQTSLKGTRKADGSSFYGGPSEELTRTWKAVSDAYYLSEAKAREIDKQAIDDVFPRLPATAFSRQSRPLVKKGAWEQTDEYKNAMRAMDTSTAGEGLEYVGQGYVGELWEEARQGSVIFNQLDTFEMTAPTMFLPFEVDIPKMQFVGENIDDNITPVYPVQTLTSKRVQVDAKKFVIHQVWSGEMEEDAIIPFVPYLRAQAQKSLEFYSDYVVLNGDTVTAATGNINSVDAAPASYEPYLAFDGIRKAALGGTGTTMTPAGGAGTLAYADLINVRALMMDSTRYVNWGKPSNPADLIYLTDTATADAIALLSELKTYINNYNNATVLNGEQVRIGKNPLLWTPVMATKYDVAGKLAVATPANNVRGSVTVFNRNGFKVGWRRRVKIATEQLAGRDQMRLIYSLRMGFGRFSPTGAASGIKAAATIYAAV